MADGSACWRSARYGAPSSCFLLRCLSALLFGATCPFSMLQFLGARSASTVAEKNEDVNVAQASRVATMREVIVPDIPTPRVATLMYRERR